MSVVDPADGTSLVVHVDAGYAAGGEAEDYNLTLVDGDFGAYFQTYDGRVTLHFNGVAPQWLPGWDLEFGASYLAPLKPGVYEGRRLIREDISSRRLAVSPPPGLYAYQVSGKFEVKKISYGPNGSIISFWATFEQHYNIRPGFLRGRNQIPREFHPPGGEINPRVSMPAEDQRFPVARYDATLSGFRRG